MKENDSETKAKIMECTLALVKAEGDPAKVTVRRIIADAGVSLSAVNYHFGSKEKLINEVIRRPIMEFLAAQENPYDRYRDDPARMLKELLRLPARYLAENPNISRISILSDMTAPISDDLTDQTLAYILPAVRGLFPGKKEDEVGTIAWGLISSVQTAFLRSRNLKALAGVDYFDQAQRERFIDGLVDSLT